MFIFLKLVEKIVNMLSYDFAGCIGRGIGLCGYHLSRKYRKLAVSSIKKALNKTLPEAKQIAKESFKNIGINIIEFFGDYDIPVDITGFEYVDKVNGNIFILGHFGNWELLGRIGAEYGLKIAGIGRGIDDKGLNEFLKKKRAFAGLKIFEKKDSFKHLLDFLKQKNSVGLLIDQYAGRKGIFVDFLGIPTSTTHSPVLLSIRTGCQILPVFIIREKHRHKIIIEPSIAIDKHRSIKENTQLMVKPLERYIKKYPEQWWWVHRRWR